MIRSTKNRALPYTRQRAESPLETRVFLGVIPIKGMTPKIKKWVSKGALAPLAGIGLQPYLH